MIPERMYDGSYVYGVVSQSERLQNRLRTSHDRSALGRGVETLGSITRHSFLFRWLTAEPDPDVIVIDLRETVTVGPLLAVLDSVLSVLTDAWSALVSVPSRPQSNDTFEQDRSESAVSFCSSHLL
ncbi:hypothetical protein ACFQH8_01515 [Halomicroarcula sp. GCM10025710]